MANGERDIKNIEDTSVYVASLFKYGDKFSVIPRLKKVNNNGVYLDTDAREVYAIYDKKYSRINIKDAGQVKVIRNAFYSEGSEFFTAVLCMFHPKYASIDNEDNALDIILESEHEFSKTGLKAIYVKTAQKKDSDKMALSEKNKKRVALEDWLF